ncbi:tetratricopeptide repeat protein [Chromatocurvus halotolerans]|uniref:Tetratricopeptide repeat protein n=2 Tax=Chromatocurvus halotolerans TaxID=1132028 RepID=A0A4V2SBH2_9GAMM|nr:tetratricopeptide repeat protein [Chromatocurvus halotolerans]
MSLADSLQQIYSLYQKKQFARAQAALRPIMARHANSPDAWRLAGMLGRATGQRDQAEHALRYALSLQKNHPETLNTLGSLMRDQLREFEAEGLYRTALDHAPQHTAVKTNLCRLLLAQQRPLEVIRLTQDLASQGPPALWRLRGEALLTMGRAELALIAFDRSLALEPASATGMQGWVRSLFELGKIADGAAVAEAHAAGNVGFAVLLVRALMEQGKWSQATELARATAARDPNAPNACFVAAQLLWMQGETAALEDLLQNAVAQAAGPGPLLTCAEIRRSMGDTGAAHALVDLCESRFGASTQAACVRNNTALEEGNLALALKAGERAYQLGEQDIRCRASFVQSLLVNGAAERALPIIEETLGKAPQHQLWLALWRDGLRQLDDERQAWLMDYDKMVGSIRLQTPPGYTDLAEFNRALAEVLRPLHQAKHHPLDQSLLQGSQTSMDLRFIDSPVIRRFMDSVGQAIKGFVSAMPDDNTHPLYCRKDTLAAPTAMWSVRLEPTGRHVNHIHSQGWLSSAYYVDLPPDDASDPRAGSLQLGEPRYPTPGTAVERTVPAEAGNLVLFPSYAWHGTVPARTGTRLSIAFDITPQSELR